MVLNCYPYFDPEFDSLSERMPPLRVCIDNETCDDHTLVKVDSANRHGILLEMVQVLADLDLIISKSYVSSDGEWLMDVFHITDHHGKKLADPAIIQNIQQSFDVARQQKGYSAPTQVETFLNSLIGVNQINSDWSSSLEITAIDHPGLLSEVTAVLFELSCGMDSGEVWTHNGRAAFILYITEQSTGEPISDPTRLGYVEEQVRNVVEAHHFPGELQRVRLLGPTAHRTHTERRLHQLLQADKDYEVGSPLSLIMDDHLSLATKSMEVKRWFGYDSASNGGVYGPYVSIESWKERDYLVVNVRSRDRPKLLFDTVCVLTDLDYDVFHASMSSHGSIAIQEYYVRRMDGCIIDNEMERRSVVQCLVAALERRMPHGPKMELRTLDRHGLLSDVCRVFRENGLSLEKAKFAKQGDWVVGSFYIIDASPSVDDGDVDQQRLDEVRNKIGNGINSVDDKNNYEYCRRGWLTPCNQFNSLSRANHSQVFWKWSVHSMLYSLGRILWSYIERFSNNLPPFNHNKP